MNVIDSRISRIPFAHSRVRVQLCVALFICCVNSYYPCVPPPVFKVISREQHEALYLQNSIFTVDSSFRRKNTRSVIEKT